MILFNYFYFLTLGGNQKTIQMIDSALVEITSTLRILQVPVILTIVILSFGISKSQPFKEFKIIGLAWIFNMLHIFLFLFTDSISHFGVSAILLKSIISFCDLSAGFFLLFATRVYLNDIQWIYNAIVPKKAKWLLLGFIAAWVFNFIALTQSKQYTLIDDFKVLLIFPYMYVLFIAFNSFGNYITILYNNKKIDYTYLVQAIKIYALIQFLPILFSIKSFGFLETPISLVGYLVGIITKTMLAYGLARIYLELNKRLKGNTTDPFLKILHEGFHEIKQPTKAVESNCVILLDSDDYHLNSKIKPIINQIRTANSLSFALQNSYETLIPHYKSVNLYSDYDNKMEKVLHNKDKVSNNLNGILQMSYFMVSKIYRIDDLKVSFDYGSNSDVFSHIHEMYQIFRNIFNNTFEAFSLYETISVNDRYSPLVTVKTNQITIEKKKHIKIEICDNGSGVLSKDIPNIFIDGFSTKKEFELDPKRGHGLFVANKIVKSYNGSIKVESKENKNFELSSLVTKFTVILPVRHLTQL